MHDITIEATSTITADEVVKLRLKSGWDGDLEEWTKCLHQNLINIIARNSKGELLGAGFLSGNARHAEVVDLVVDPDYREHGIGEGILEQLIEYAKSEKIKYLGLTYNKKSPWLKDFYEKQGFQSIDFAMWYKDSLQSR